MSQRILIHVGADKAASSAIQSFLFVNKEVLLARGLRVCRTRFHPEGGHPYLFQYFDDSDWRALAQEIDADDESHTFLLSWEGIYRFDAAALSRIKALLPNLPIEVVFVMREQAALIASGILQRVKQGDLPFDVRDSKNHVRKFFDGRDYHDVLQRLASVYGPQCVRPMTYVPRDMIKVFMAEVGIRLDSAFSSPDFQNESLTLEGAIAAQACDYMFPYPAAMEEARRRIAASKYRREGTRRVLPPGSVAEIQTHFARSNLAVAQSWFGREALFDDEDVALRRPYNHDVVRLLVLIVLTKPLPQPWMQDA